MMHGIAWLHDLLTAFIPLFVSIDAFGLVPLFLAITEGMSEQRRKSVTYEAASFALALCVSFMFLGNAIFQFLGITQADFRIAGGILLLVLAIIDLLIRGKPAVDSETETIGLFPLAMPLIAGPATLTTTLVLAARHPYGYALTSLSLAINFAILVVVLLFANRLSRLLGTSALRAASKLVMVLLAAIAVNLIRTGIVQAWVESTR